MGITQGAIIFPEPRPGPRPDSPTNICPRVSFSFSPKAQLRAELTAVRDVRAAKTRQDGEPRNRTGNNPPNLQTGEPPRLICIRIHDGQRISDRLVKAGEILGCEQRRGKGIVHVDCGSRVQWRVSIRVAVAGVGEDERAGAIPLKGMPGVEFILSNGGERPVDEAVVECTTTTLILRENKDVHHENDTIFVAEHVIGVVLFLGGELDIS